VIITGLTIFTFVIVYAVFLIMQEGLTLSNERLGADIIVLPDKAKAGAYQTLFTGSPANIYMPISLMLLMERLGLIDRKDFLPYQLSGGQRRRAMIARAMINYPDLILADEPTNDLEDVWVEEIFQLFKEARQESCAVVMVTHHHRWAAEAAVQYKLEQGKLTLLDN